MSFIEKMAVVAVVVEVAVMVLARFGAERRNWNHYKKRGPVPDSFLRPIRDRTPPTAVHARALVLEQA